MINYDVIKCLDICTDTFAWYPSEISCKQDLAQHTTYTNLSRSSKFTYKIIMASSTKILDTDITRSWLQIGKILGSDCKVMSRRL